MAESSAGKCDAAGAEAECSRGSFQATTQCGGVRETKIEYAAKPSTGAAFYGGNHDLEVVGESYYQDALWQVVGGRTTDRVRANVRAILVPETDNPYDSNAISVWIDGRKVGHLSREDASDYRAGLLALEAREQCRIALEAVVVGGGIRANGLGYLGVWLSHDPADFGLVSVTPPTPPVLLEDLRTGLSHALATDAEDDSYDLSWLADLPTDHTAAIKRLRNLLRQDPDPIDRHFMFCELERRLYRAREAFASALDEYDEACRLHDAEMDGIRDALLNKFGKVPLLETYTQMAIRQQKAKNWSEAIRWANRGLALYGDHAARPEAVEDLKKRVVAYTSKLRGSTPRRQPYVEVDRDHHSATETLRCETCGRDFQRVVARGRKPRQCTACRPSRV
jgi:tetratricopeptide (TPR) repeat protein